MIAEDIDYDAYMIDAEHYPIRVKYFRASRYFRDRNFNKNEITPTINRYKRKAKRWREKRQCIATTLSDFVGFAWENIAKSHPNSFARYPIDWLNEVAG